MFEKEKFPTDVLVCFDSHGTLHVFTDISEIPVWFGKEGIKIAKYHIVETATVKEHRTYDPEKS